MRTDPNPSTVPLSNIPPTEIKPIKIIEPPGEPVILVSSEKPEKQLPVNPHKKSICGYCERIFCLCCCMLGLLAGTAGALLYFDGIDTDEWESSPSDKTARAVLILGCVWAVLCSILICLSFAARRKRREKEKEFPGMEI
jgi:hypothetical protein